MKTTISIPDLYHKRLKKIAIDRSATLNDLVAEALQHKFFHSENVVENQDFPFNQLKGVLGKFSSSEAEIKQLKKIWKPSK